VSADELLRALLGDDPSLAPLTQRLITRTEGNPFFLEESVRTLVETRVLVGDRGTYRLPQPLDTWQVPATVQALLAARIDRLSPEDKRLLQTAAVIGTDVPWPLLEVIADVPEEALYRSLAQLQAAEFLYETRLFPERAYTFKHALTHEVAYGSLLHERRRALHARIVEALEALAGDRLDDHVDRLAHHALRGEVWEQALVYGLQAGNKAQTRSAYREALTAFEQALVASAHLPDSRAVTEQAIDLHLGIHGALNALSEAPEQMLNHLRRAEALGELLGDQRRLGSVYATMCLNGWLAGEVDRAIVYGQRALAVAATLGHVGLQAWAHLNLGRTYYDIGDYARAVEHLERNVATLQGERLAERFGANNLAAASGAWLSRCHAELGAFTAGLAIAEEGLRIAETVKNPFSLVEVCHGVSVVSLRQGDVPRAIPVLERAVGLCQDWDIPLLVPGTAAALGLAYALEGRTDEGLALVKHGVEQLVAKGRPRHLAFAVTCLSQAYLLAGRLEEARQRATQAVDLARQYQERGHQAYALRLLGDIATQRDPPEGESAVAHYQQAFALAEALGMRPLQAHCHLGLGTLYAKTGQLEQARTELAAASSWRCTTRITTSACRMPAYVSLCLSPSQLTATAQRNSGSPVRQRWPLA
jgi:tetratricopeptide (TPR) repeat protein